MKTHLLIVFGILTAVPAFAQYTPVVVYPAPPPVVVVAPLPPPIWVLPGPYYYWHGHRYWRR